MFTVNDVNVMRGRHDTNAVRLLRMNKLIHVSTTYTYRLEEAGVLDWTFRSPKDVLTFKAAAGTDIVNALPGLEEAKISAREKIVSAIN
jgi:hypothetical protein